MYEIPRSSRLIFGSTPSLLNSEQSSILRLSSHAVAHERPLFSGATAEPMNSSMQFPYAQPVNVSSKGSSFIVYKQHGNTSVPKIPRTRSREKSIENEKLCLYAPRQKKQASDHNDKLCLPRAALDLKQEAMLRGVQQRLFRGAKTNSSELVEITLREYAKLGVEEQELLTFPEKDSHGNDVFHHAARHNRVEIFSALVDNLVVNFDRRNSKGETPLMIASTYGHYACAKLLVKVSIDPNAEDPHGYTALDRTIIRSHKSTSCVLMNNPKVIPKSATDLNNEASDSSLNLMNTPSLVNINIPSELKPKNQENFPSVYSSFRTIKIPETSSRTSKANLQPELKPTPAPSTKSKEIEPNVLFPKQSTSPNKTNTEKNKLTVKLRALGILKSSRQGATSLSGSRQVQPKIQNSQLLVKILKPQKFDLKNEDSTQRSGIFDSITKAPETSASETGICAPRMPKKPKPLPQAIQDFIKRYTKGEKSSKHQSMASIESGSRDRLSQFMPSRMLSTTNGTTITEPSGLVSFIRSKEASQQTILGSNPLSFSDLPHRSEKDC